MCDESKQQSVLPHEQHAAGSVSTINNITSPLRVQSDRHMYFKHMLNPRILHASTHVPVCQEDKA